jgi:alkanesulfonate monooxygenase SsuD/methylene tetrahydromethanopterin reductase-like flavin-dependent oxidoreductase (luciferase family)
LVIPPRIGFGLPRGVGVPSTPFVSVDHRATLRYAQLAERLGFDSVWVPDHFCYEWPPGEFEPFPEAWTLMTAIGATTDRVQIGSMVLAPAFRHPAVLARMAGALQQLTGGRLVLGVGAGNQPAEHHAFGFSFDGRVSRLSEYLAILHGLLANERVTLNGRFYTLNDASVMMSVPPVSIWVAGSGPRMLDLTATYARGWDAGNALADHGTTFRASLGALRTACEARGRDPDQIDVSCSTNVLVLPDAATTRTLTDTIAAATGWSPATVRERYVIGTPDVVARRLTRALEWGVTHFVCSLGGRPFTLWSEAMFELFAAEVLPRLRDSVR